MKTSFRPLPAFFILIFAVIICRFLIFNCYILLEKPSFRKHLLEDPSPELKTISIPQAMLFVDTEQLEWRENNRELIINGVFHEVSNIRNIGSFAVISIIEDLEENRLFENFFKHDKQEDDGFFAELISFFAMNYLLPDASRGVCLFERSIKHGPILKEPLTDPYRKDFLRPPSKA